ncbi:conserved Plasmodium membrane protein, unknown function [Plasmodium ovale wallikeri]|uniref:Uncharacterized protein n=1 Tax=Plasmodium ovale wallikeri TaxID=864142 RepID=A0A1A8ZRD0_PLAOA|nr:conserved Plasmodium membrane protein, unknown function [Plasmodium ovale wallikeri]SBT46665.1 conserved Plasmodium membrane protein, unknown function [Plasmodium ovale wallikeri]
MFIVKSNILSDNTLDASAKKEHTKINKFLICYQNYDKLFLSDEIQEYHFMSVALSHLPFLYMCYDIVIFQYDSVFIKSTLDYTYNDNSLIVLNLLRGIFCSLSIAIIFIISMVLNIQNTFRTFPMLKLSNRKTKKYLLSVFLFYLIDSQIRIVTFLFIIETYEVNPFKIFVFIFSQIMTICVCIAFDTHIFKNIIIGISSILVSPLSIILHSTNRNYSNERVVRLSKLLINFRFFEFFLILFYGSLYYDDEEIGNTFILYIQLINLILLFFLIIIYKKVMSYKRKFEENGDELSVDLYNNINDN